MPGALAVRHPHLRAVDHVLVAVAHRLARDVARVAAGVGLREREAAAQLAASRGAAASAASAPRCRGARSARGDRVRVDDARQRHPAVRELLDHADVGEQVEPEPAVLLGDRDPEQARAPSSARRWSAGILVGVLELGWRRGSPRARRSGARSRPARRGPRDRSSQSCAHATSAATERVRRNMSGQPVPLPDTMMHQTMMSFRRDPDAVKGKHLERGSCCAACSPGCPPLPGRAHRVLHRRDRRRDHRRDPGAAVPGADRPRGPEQRTRRSSWSLARRPRSRSRSPTRGLSARAALVLRRGSARASSTTCGSRCSTTCSACRSRSSPAPRPARCRAG